MPESDKLLFLLNGSIFSLLRNRRLRLRSLVDSRFLNHRPDRAKLFLAVYNQHVCCSFLPLTASDYLAVKRNLRATRTRSESVRSRTECSFLDRVTKLCSVNFSPHK